MPRVLITAFEPYDRWPENASWLALVELTRELPPHDGIVTRRYPVDYDEARRALERDLAQNFDAAIHLGQAPGSAKVRLETFALNLRRLPSEPASLGGPLDDDGPAAYQTALPVARWCEELCAAGIPVEPSFHAGTYLCNAVFYWSQHVARRRNLRTRSVFVHVPLDPSQVTDPATASASLPAAYGAAAVKWMLDDLARAEPLVA